MVITMLWCLSVLLGVTQIAAYDTSEWKCFDEDPVVVKYVDTGNPVSLPKYKTLVGDWGSWILTNWIARILLKEKMGVDLEWWCTDDWTKYSTCDLDYPVSTWDNVENGNIDMNLEAWVRAGSIAGHLTRTYEDRVEDMGPMGTTGMALLYTADYDGTWDVGNWKSLKKQSVRDTVFADMKPIFDKYRSKGWLKTYGTAWEEPGVFAAGGKADTPATASTVITKPFILGVGFGWAHTRLIWDKINKHGLAEHWDLWIVDSEPHLSNIVDDAGAQKKHFVAQLFGPGYDLASFEKQRIAWPVPFQAGCSANATCEAELEPLFKVGNPRTMGKIPEVKTFIERLRIPGNVEMNAIMYDQLANNIEWRQAACNWLKNNVNTWQPFIIPIVRRENIDPWWKIYVEIGAILCACLFLGTLITVAWRQLAGEESQEMVQEEKLKREAAIDMMMMAGVIAFDIIDVICSSWATATCFEIAGDNVLLVVGFCVALVVEIASGIFVSLQRITVIKELRAKYNGTWQNKEGEADLKSAKMHARTEALMFIAGLGEDMPWLVLYVIVMVMGYLEPAFVAGAGMSFTGFGYKISSLEKHFLYKKMEGYTSQLLTDVGVKSKDN